MGENLASCLLLPVFAPNRILGVPHGVVGGDVVLSLRLNRGQQFFVRDQTTKRSHDLQISSDHPPYVILPNFLRFLMVHLSQSQVHMLQITKLHLAFNIERISANDSEPSSK